MFTFRKEKLNIQQMIGEGSFGKVFPYQSSPDDSRWALKVLYAKDILTLLNKIEEVVLGFNCDHPGILPIQGYSIQQAEQTGFHLYIKLPRMKGDLREVITNHQTQSVPISEKKIVIYFYILAWALEYLHDRKIAHGDLKPENILINYNNDDIKLSDIGGGKFVDNGESILINPRESTLKYLAPEFVKGDQRNVMKKNLFPGDMWSLGVVISEMMSIKNITGLSNEADIQKKLGSLTEKYSKILIELVRSLLKTNPFERKKATEIRKKLEETFKDDLVN